MTLPNRINLAAGLTMTFLGIMLVVAVFRIPLTKQIIVREYELKKEVLYELEEHEVTAANYFVSIFIKGGRNVYADTKADRSFDLYIIPIDEWGTTTNESAYETVYVKHLNKTDVSSYFTAPIDGYYVFEIFKVNPQEPLMIKEFQVTANWSVLVDKVKGEDYDYNIFYLGTFLGIIGLSFTLYAIIPKLRPPGIL